MSIFSAHDMLASLGVELDPILVGEATPGRLRELCARLPYMGAAQYVECRLGAGASSVVDFLMSVNRVQRESRALRADDLDRLGPGYVELSRLLRAWIDPRSRLHEPIAAVWVEFDGVNGARSVGPNVCASVAPSYVDPFAPLVSQSQEELFATLCDCLNVIRGRPGEVRETEVLRRCVASLPSGAHWIHLSVMGRRNPPVNKLYGVFPESTLMGYLRQLEWGGDATALERQIRRYCPSSRTGGALYVDLPLSGTSMQRVSGLGICFSQQQVRVSEERDPTHRRLLATLVEDGLCTPEQARVLSAWPRVQPVGTSKDFFLKQWLDIKLVQEGSARPLAKAYLGFTVMRGAARD